MRGHGDSERPLSGYRIADMADDVIRLMDALNIPKAVLIGHSMGVVRGPQGVRAGAVPDLEAGAGRRCAHVRQRRASWKLQGVVNELTDPVDETFVRDFQMSTIAAPVPEPFLEAVIANSRRMPARIWKAVMRGLIEFEPAVGATRRSHPGPRRTRRMRCSPAPSRWCSRASFRSASSISSTASVTRSTGSNRRSFVSALMRFGV